MRRLLSVLFDLGIVLVAAVALWGILSRGETTQIIIDYTPVPLVPLLLGAAPWAEVLAGLFAVLVFLRLTRRHPPPPQAKGREKEEAAAGARRTAIDLSGIARDAPDALERVGALLAQRARDETVEVTDLVDDIIVAAEFVGASDVHIEPKEATVRLSFRVDGIIREVANLPKEIDARLTNRFRVISHLDFAKVDTPQDGRVEEKIRGKAMNLRVSVFPTLWGAKVVLRLLDSGAHALPELSTLGIAPEVLKEFRRIIHAPQGLLLFTGPTGSGKTTLMYSTLLEIVQNEEMPRNIVTLEDPIERVLAAVNQTQVDAKRGLSFASGLRTILRQDPDIIMVGEIRDVETAEIAFRAGQTGHLIMTTLHTSSSAGAFSRLIDMGLEPFLLASAISGIVGTRLIRRLCPACKVQKAPSELLLSQLPARPPPDFRYFESKGCPECRNTGFIGRMLVFELLTMSEPLAAAVLARQPQAELARIAVAQGMRTMLQDGLMKVGAGETSLAELLRVVQ